MPQADSHNGDSTKARRWKTWVKHLILDAVIVFACSLFFAVPFHMAASWRLFREIEQQLPKWRTNTTGQWTGSIGDVASGWIGGALMWWILTL